MSSCFGGTEATLDALASGKDGTVGLDVCAGFSVPGVDVVYADPTITVPYQQRAEVHLRRAWCELVDSGSIGVTTRMAVIICSGLGSTPTAETGGGSCTADVVRSLLGDQAARTPVYSISNACSASGMGVAMADLLLRDGGLDQVIVTAADSMSRSMLTMIGRVAAGGPAARCRPFDTERQGAVLGEGAAVCVLTRDDAEPPDASMIAGRIHATAVSTDAAHLTAPDAVVISSTVDRALRGADITFGDLDLVIPHGTGTEMNDRIEIEVYAARLAASEAVTFSPLKGLLGHTSGASFLMSAFTALHALRGNPTAACRPDHVMTGARSFRFGSGEPLATTTGLALVSAYGFGGVNAVAVVGR